jgi:hypothetical protein
MHALNRSNIQRDCEVIRGWANRASAELETAAPTGAPLPNLFAPAAVVEARDRIVAHFDEAGIWSSALGNSSSTKMVAPDAFEFLQHVEYVLNAAK